MSGRKSPGPAQLDLPLFAPAPPPRAVTVPSPLPPPPPAPSRARPGLRLIQGGGQRRHEALASRDAVVRVLLEAGADLLLRRISAERAGEIEGRVDRILRLFDQVDRSPALMPVLKARLDDLEALMRETRELRPARRSI